MQVIILDTILLSGHQLEALAVFTPFIIIGICAVVLLFTLPLFLGVSGGKGTGT